MCREKSSIIHDFSQFGGSPLRVQGKVYETGCPVSKVQDHPCVCREKVIRICRIQPVLGSPLRVQGKVVTVIFAVVYTRITPACAGKRYCDAKRNVNS